MPSWHWREDADMSLCALFAHLGEVRPVVGPANIEHGRYNPEDIQEHVGVHASLPDRIDRVEHLLESVQRHALGRGRDYHVVRFNEGPSGFRSACWR